MAFFCIAAMISGSALAQADRCEDAQPLPLGLVLGTLANATLDGSNACGERLQDVWYTFTPTEPGVLVIDGCQMPGALMVSVHTGCPGTAANQLACNSRDSYNCGSRPHLQVALTSGVEYRVRVASTSLTGSYTFATYYIPPRQPGGHGPDVVSGDIPEYRTYGTAGGYAAYALGSTACNVGDQNAEWTNIDNSNHHPVISTSMYRLANGKIDQIGYAWLKHGWASGTETFCDYCPESGVLPYLIPGCSDSYDVPQNGTQIGLGPRSEVDPTTGYFPYPPSAPAGITDNTSRRIRVPVDTVTPESNPTARYFAELHYVAADDAAAGNALNNASYRELVGVTPTTIGGFNGITQRDKPAIMAWAESDPTVLAVPLDFSDRGYTTRFWVASAAKPAGDGSWTYTYSVFNLNADRAAASLMLPRLRGVTATAATFWMPQSHSGEPYSNTPWQWRSTPDWFGFECPQTFVENPNAGALRWGVMATMTFSSPRPPVDRLARLGLFKPGNAGEQAELAVNVRVPSAVPCVADFDDDGFSDGFDYDAFVACFQGVGEPGCSADINADGFVDGFDYDAFVIAFELGC